MRVVVLVEIDRGHALQLEISPVSRPDKGLLLVPDAPRCAQDDPLGPGNIGHVAFADGRSTTVLKPEVDVEENDLTITVRVRIGKVRPLDIQLLLSPDAMVIRAEQSATAKRMFRTVQFPRRIDVGKTEVKYEDGYLILTA